MKSSIGCFLVCLAAVGANANAATYLLNESSDPSAFANGTDYVQVQLTNIAPGEVTFTVTPESVLGKGAEIVDFAFDYSGPDAGAVKLDKALSPGVSLSQSSGDVSDFGHFTFDVDAKNPQSSLSFTLTGLAGGSATATLSYLEQLSTRGVTREDFATEVAGLKTGAGAYCDPRDVYFGGQQISPVPEPSTWVLIFSGLSVMGFWAMRRRGAASGIAGQLLAS